MDELGSIYGTTVDGSNTLVIDFSNVQINGTLNLPESNNNGYGITGDILISQGTNNPAWDNINSIIGQDVTTTGNPFFASASTTGDFGVGGVLYTPYHRTSGHYTDNGRVKMYTRDMYISAPWVHLGVGLDANTSLDWDYPNNSAQNSSKVIITAKSLVSNAQFTPWSDDRIKHFEKDIVNSLDTIRKLKPVKYTKTFKIYPDNYNGSIDEEGQIESGFIAQEVLKIPDLSYCVMDEYINDEGIVIIPYTLKYNDLFVYNIAATQELDIIVQNQQTEITELKNENTLLKNALNTLLSEAGKPTI